MIDGLMWSSGIESVHGNRVQGVPLLFLRQEERLGERRWALHWPVSCKSCVSYIARFNTLHYIVYVFALCKYRVKRNANKSKVCQKRISFNLRVSVSICVDVWFEFAMFAAATDVSKSKFAVDPVTVFARFVNKRNTKSKTSPNSISATNSISSQSTSAPEAGFDPRHQCLSLSYIHIYRSTKPLTLRRRLCLSVSVYLFVYLSIPLHLFLCRSDSLCFTSSLPSPLPYNPNKPPPYLPKSLCLHVSLCLSLYPYPRASYFFFLPLPASLSSCLSLSLSLSPFPSPSRSADVV